MFSKFTVVVCIVNTHIHTSCSLYMYRQVLHLIQVNSFLCDHTVYFYCVASMLLTM